MAQNQSSPAAYRGNLMKWYLAIEAWSLTQWYLEPVVELRWGPRGPGPPERPGDPRETSVLRGFKGVCKRPLKLQDDHPSFIDASLQFASVFVLTLQ